MNELVKKSRFFTSFPVRFQPRAPMARIHGEWAYKKKFIYFLDFLNGLNDEILGKSAQNEI